MLNPILLTAICAVVSFFIGAIPFGLILGRVFNHTDIRKAGSGNIGTTNALRVAGPKVAALTLLRSFSIGAAAATAACATKAAANKLRISFLQFIYQITSFVCTQKSWHIPVPAPLH